MIPEQMTILIVKNMSCDQEINKSTVFSIGREYAARQTRPCVKLKPFLIVNFVTVSTYKERIKALSHCIHIIPNVLYALHGHLFSSFYTIIRARIYIVEY